MAYPDQVASTSVSFNRVDYRLRPLHPGDEARLQRFFYSHSPETIRLRYGYMFTMMSKDRARELVDVDEQRGFALGIFSGAGENEELHAIGRYCVESDTQAEVAFVVRETRRRCGMAKRLLLELAREAEVHGIRVFRAQVLRENHPMRQMLDRYRPIVRDDPDGNGLDYFVKVRAIKLALGRPA